MARQDYVEISREDIEAWLDSLPHRWSRKAARAGIYYVHFSEMVGCAVSTTIGRSDMAVDKAKGSMQLTLVSLVTGQTLNRKDQDRKHFQRTLNWRKTWAEGIKHWLGVYQKMASFYDRIAPIEDRARYHRDMIAKIESIRDWASDHMLSSLHQQVSKGSILSDAQVAVLERALSEPEPEVIDSGALWGRWTEVARNVFRAARSARHQFGMDISESLGRMFKAEREPSDKQWRAFLNVADQFGVEYNTEDLPDRILPKMASVTDRLVEAYLRRGVTT